MSTQHDIGLWAERLSSKRFDNRPALFLDRDGVIVEEVHFLSRSEDLRLIDGVGAAIAAANARNIAVVIVTNQSGIARGHYGWEEFEAVQTEILRQLAAESAAVDLVLACGYHEDGIGPLGCDHPWRKPGSGMLLEAERQLGLDLTGSLIVGDRISDIRAGKAAGLKSGVLVKTGYGADEWERQRELIEEWRFRDHLHIELAETATDAIRIWLERP